MFEREITLYAFNLAHLQRVAADLAEDSLDEQPAPGLKPPRWVLGHLAIATDLGLRCLGVAEYCPREWHEAFGPGSPLGAPGPRPSKAELVAAIEAGHGYLTAALPNADPEHLAGRHKVAILRSTPLVTWGDVVGHLMTNHAAFHISQLSACRRQAGHAPLF